MNWIKENVGIFNLVAVIIAVVSLLFCAYLLCQYMNIPRWILPLVVILVVLYLTKSLLDEISGSKTK